MKRAQARAVGVMVPLQVCLAMLVGQLVGSRQLPQTVRWLAYVRGRWKTLGGDARGRRPAGILAGSVGAGQIWKTSRARWISSLESSILAM